jgi:ATP-dependent exoDNAse (exonuclease V) beta subunit
MVSDASVRERALDPALSFLIEAPAGSGKTELLIQRYLRLLSLVERPESVVAMTFTRKAALEMKDRVLSALREAAQNTPAEDYALITRALSDAVLSRDRELKWNLLADPGRIQISTIDSFCALLTRQMPVLAGLGGSPQVIEHAEELYRRAAERTLILLAETPEYQEIFRHLTVHFDCDLKMLSSQIAAMLGKRDQWVRALKQKQLDVLRNEIDAALVTCIEARLQKLQNLWPEQLGGCPEPRVETLQSWQHAASRLLRSGSKEPRAAYKGLLSAHTEFCSALVRCQKEWPLAVNDEQWQLISNFIVTLQLALEVLESVFRERGQVDFTRITQAAVDALGHPDSPSDLAYRLDYRIEHLLVDEFQDTSLVQYELLDRLTGQWSADDGRTLFVVGDPMQSIYRFRDAEVGLFLRAGQRGLGSVRLERLQLASNFRSTPAIVNWVNRAFENVLPAQDDINYGEVSLRKSRAARNERGPAPTFHAFVEDDNEQEECARIVEIARTALKQGRDTAILGRTRAQLRNVFVALRTAEIPYEAIDIDVLADEQHILDLVSLTRAIHFSSDRISWLACLRAPWCGLTLMDLAKIVGDDSKVSLSDRVADRDVIRQLPPDAQLRLVRFAEIMHAAQASFGRVPASELVRAAWVALGGPAALRRENHRQDAETFFGLLQELDIGGVLPDFNLLNERLQNLFARSGSHKIRPVQVMTIHAAKGLEFDTVIVPKLGKLAGNLDRELLLWTERLNENGTEQLLMAACPQSRAEDDLFNFVKREVDLKERAEDRRLLYVAATRAKNELHLLGGVETGKNGQTLKVSRGSFLQMLWNEAEPHFEQARKLKAKAEPAQGSLLLTDEARNVLWRLPATWAVPRADPSVVWTSRYRLEAASDQEVTYDWVSDTGRHVGTVVHDMLRRIAEDGIEEWSGARIAEHKAFAVSELALLGVPPEELDDAASRIVTALSHTIRSERGRWILAPDPQAACEWALAGLIDDRLETARIDRTFVDGAQRRWIIDYKTSTHEGGGAQTVSARRKTALPASTRVLRASAAGAR